MEDHLPVEITDELVRELLAEQHPDLADHPVRQLATGWDNATYRLGDDLTVRIPRRIEGAHLIDHERLWLPVLLDGVPDHRAGGLDASAHLRAGIAGAGYPWSWAIGRWHEGAPASTAPVIDLDDAADRLGCFLAALHRPAPPDAPANPWRGGPLVERTDLLGQHLDRVERLGRSLGSDITRSAVEERWADLVATPASKRGDDWIHGDLHLANLVARDGSLTAVIDFGDLTSGDRATDLAIAWPLFGDDAEARARFRHRAGAKTEIDDATWRRARGWALALAVAYIQGEHTDEAMERFARRGLAAALTYP